jgi:hypothetical protein
MKVKDLIKELKKFKPNEEVGVWVQLGGFRPVEGDIMLKHKFSLDRANVVGSSCIDLDTDDDVEVILIG